MELQEANRGIRERNEFGHEHEPELVAGATKEGRRLFFWIFLYGYTIFGAIATVESSCCPASGTVPASGDPVNGTWVPPAEAAPDAVGQEYGWGDRWDADGGRCGTAAICAGFSLLLLPALIFVYKELGAMRSDRR